MTLLIPSVISQDYKSPGEREIFSKLRDDPFSKDWIALHSLDVAQHRKQVAGEIDFVVIIPGKGVLCLEVKACERLFRDRGLWYYGKNAKPDSKGPFKQASDAMHSIKDRLIKQRPDLKTVVFWSAVIFPYVDFSDESVEWHQWQVINQRKYQTESIGKLLERVLNSALQHLRNKNVGWFRPDSTEPSIDQCKLIAKVLRPDFEFYESPKSRIRRLLNEVKRYTEDQFQALDAMSANERIVFSGPAGTGKTLLAIESARRSNLKGNKVLFLCFNRLLGEWIKEQFKEVGVKINAEIFHDYMLNLAGMTRPDTNSDCFWQKKLPDLAVEKLMSIPGNDHLYDEIVIDEGQDLLRRNYVDVLDLSLRGGLAEGNWRLFGDFKTQAIYGGGDISLEEFLKERAGNAHQYLLTTNCRNTPRVAKVAANLVKLTDLYKKILRPDSGIMPEVRFYSSANDQCKLLVACLEELKKENITFKDVAVLSTHGNDNCVAHSINIQAWKGKLRPYVEATTGGDIRYCSIHAFKGMEAPVIIVTDVDTFEKPTSRTLFYIAATRALYRLIILANKDIKDEMNNAIRLVVS